MKRICCFFDSNHQFLDTIAFAKGIVICWYCGERKWNKYRFEPFKSHSLLATMLTFGLFPRCMPDV